MSAGIITIDEDLGDAWFNRALVEIELTDHKSALADPDQFLAIKHDHERDIRKGKS